MRDHLWWGTSALEHFQGHWYSFYPIAGPVLVTPLYLPALAFPSLREQSPETLIAIARIAEKFIAVALAAGASVLMLRLLQGLAPRRWAWGIALVFALGTSTWSLSSQALWQHTFGPVAIIESLYGLMRWETEAAENRWLWVCGAGAGIALVIRPTNLWLLLALVAALWVRRTGIRNYARLLTPVLVLAVPWALYNWLVFHRLTGGYQWQYGNLVKGLVGLLVSPGRGLLVYIPVVFFALAVWLPAAQANRRKHRSLVTACAVFTALHFLTIAAWFSWWGGFCWGPRYLAEMIAPLVILIGVAVPALQSRGWGLSFAGVAVYCCLIQALGVYFYPKGRWDLLPVSVDSHPERVWDWADNPIIRTARGGLVWEPYVIVTTAALQGIPAAAQKLRQYGIHAY